MGYRTQVDLIRIGLGWDGFFNLFLLSSLFVLLYSHLSYHHSLFKQIPEPALHTLPSQPSLFQPRRVYTLLASPCPAPIIISPNSARPSGTLVHDRGCRCTGKNVQVYICVRPQLCKSVYDTTKMLRAGFIFKTFCGRGGADDA